ncbi:hypothetical protein SAMN04488570_1959 [Nocardioides scoriae]|uniref:Uncharacterized protein n=1 Tax=Nocardioides scoriae TaxID=642780 RepID=A0A1H1SI22_9ACTN|nr:hypothetical protein [Nocardioides scoriae]SDS47523.1 hypothetical protein SAMN04488570_1959 [Nocardioides scoriae]
MNTLDRARLGLYVLRHDFWLDLHDVPRRRRRELREELRANVADASHDVGTEAALAGLGSPRTLARENAAGTVGTRGARARWTAGLQWGVAAFVVMMLLWTLSVLAFVDGVTAAGATGRVTGSVFPWGGSVTAEVGSGLQVWGTVPPSIWVLTLVAAVLGARPWLLARRG